MDLSLKGNRAIVCGSTDGIGKASALLMAERGASITLVARNKEKLNATLTELSTDHGQKHATVCADFNKPDELKQMMLSEEYWNRSKRNPEVVKKVEDGYRRLYK